MDKVLAGLFGPKVEFSSYQVNLAQELGLISKIEGRKFLIEQFMKTKKLICLEYLIQCWELFATFDNYDYIDSIYRLSIADTIDIVNCMAHLNLKKNAICFIGPSNSGKSILARALLLPFAPGGIQRDGGTNVHWLENTIYKNYVLWEEPIITCETREDSKLICGGERHVVNVKNKPLQFKEDKSVVLVTTNTPFWLTDLSRALQNRLIIKEFGQQIERRITESDVLGYILTVYRRSTDGEFSESLSKE